MGNKNKKKESTGTGSSGASRPGAAGMTEQIPAAFVIGRLQENYVLSGHQDLTHSLRLGSLKKRKKESSR